MKKLILSICIALLACQCFAQATIRVTKDSLKFQLKYDVLKADPTVREGYYQCMIKASARIITTGYYKNNKRDGLWHEYDNSDHVIVEGHYKDGQKVGEWKYFDNLWKLANVYDFTKRELTYHLPTTIDSTIRFNVVLKPRDTLTTLLNRAPVYLGGDILMYRALADNLVPPPAAMQAGFAGKTVISFTVDVDGQVKDYRFARSAGYDCDLAALKAVKMIPNNWLPGRLGGRNVAVVMRLPVGFDFRSKQQLKFAK